MLQPVGCHVTLMEAPDIGTIGVGEATVPPLVKFVRIMRLDEAEFMRRCRASYKLGIKFIDWHRVGHSYWHPFGLCGGQVDGLDLFPFWLRHARETGQGDAYSHFSLQAGLGDALKGPRGDGVASPVMDTGAYAYHLDAAALAAYLQELAVGEGVTHRLDTVRDVVLGEAGEILAVGTDRGERVEADLFIDCSGFAGRLIEQALGDPWIDWSDTLLCDSAMVAALPRDGRMPAYTRATAQDAGWMWRIPLSHRTGCGYVYSSNHASGDEAIDVVRELGGEPRKLRMRVGRRTAFWHRNCVSVGLSSGFVEPLESTGIYLIQRAIELLLEYFPDRDFNPALSRAFNARMARMFEEVRDFIVLHYVLSKRDDTAFWRDSRAVTLPDSLAETIALHDETGKVETDRVSLFQEPSLHFLFAGNERLPRRVMPPADIARPDRIAEVLGQMHAQNRRLTESLPAHAALMASLHGSQS